MAARKLAWASDEETRMDLELLAEDARGARGPLSLPMRFWVYRLDAAKRLSPVDLAALRPVDAAERERLAIWLSSSESQGIKAARRRWAPALALAGAFDVDEGEGAKPAFLKASALAGAWLLSWHPDFARKALDRGPASALVAQGRREISVVALGSLFDFGAQLGLSNPESLAIKAVSETELNEYSFSIGRVPSADGQARAQALALYLERVALERSALSGKPGGLARPRL